MSNGDSGIEGEDQSKSVSQASDWQSGRAGKRQAVGMTWRQNGQASSK